MSEVRHSIEQQLRLHEGVVDHAYKDSLGFLTIGVGRLIDPRKGGKISDGEIDVLLDNDLNRVAAELDLHIPWWRGLDPVRKKVVLDMAFNMGWPTLSQFKNTLAAIERGDFTRAQAGMLASLWARQVKGRAVRLGQMMASGDDYGV